MSEKTEDELDKVCNILDKLTLDALLLMENEIQTKLNIEDAMSLGENNLAKARYIMGQNKVSQIQLPTEKTPEFTAAIKVYSNKDEKLLNSESFEIHKSPKTNDNNVIDPIKWFGVLVPQNLTHAQKMFQQALQWVIKSVNIQTELQETITKIHEVKSIKQKLISEREL